MSNDINLKDIIALVEQCVDFEPVKGYRKTYTNNHKHIVEKRRAGIDVDNPLAVEWQANWTICGMTNADFTASLGGNGELRVGDITAKTKKAVADQVHERIVLELAHTFWEYVDYGFGHDERLADAILKTLTEFASTKEKAQ